MTTDADPTVPPAPVSDVESMPPPTPEPAPAEDPAPETPVPEAPPPADPCREALTWVSEAGLPLPPGVGYHCPSTEFAHHGAACWHASPCPATAFISVNLDLMAGTGTLYLRHVVAHEVCHILDFQAGTTTSEAGADACAAAHGAPA
jgi:hypothetical protein